MINFEQIRDIIEKARKEHFTDKGLATMEGIYYMNGNDGTDFDWGVNNRVCEFYIWKPDESGLIKFLAERGNTFTMYVYDYESPYSGKYKKYEGTLDIDMYDLACHLQASFDDKGIWNAPVDSWTLDKKTYL